MLGSRMQGGWSIIIVFAAVMIASSSYGARMQVSLDEAQPGTWTTITVGVDSLDFEISGFDITLAVDQSTYGLVRPGPGQFCEDCQWEYYTYRIIPFDSLPDFDLMSRTDLVKVTAFAAVNEGYEPLCYSAGSSVDLVELRLLVDYERHYPFEPISCMFLPVQFFWRDCNDNVLYSRNNDTVYTANVVYKPWSDDPVTLPFPGFGAPDSPCPDPPGQVAVNSLTLTNGGLDLTCCDSAYAWRGDINLNGRPYEMGDLVLYCCYWLWGLPCFAINLEGQIAQTDINGDGLALSVADMVYLVRLIMHEIAPVPKYATDQLHANSYMNAHDGKTRFSLDVNADVGAVYLRFVGDNGQILEPSEFTFFGPEFEIGQIGDTTTMLLIDIEQGNPVLAAGMHSLFEYSGADVRLAHIEVVDYCAVPFKVNRQDAALPQVFTLKRNFPNPFNPSTTIEFFLPTTSEWKLSIRNVLGQVVSEYRGIGRGEIGVDWDGCDAAGVAVASGIYFYRLQSDAASQTRKMLMLK